MIHRVGWSVVAGLLGLLGMASAVLLWRLGTLLSAAVMTAVVAAAFVWCRSSGTSRSAGGIAVRALCWAGVVVAAGGLCTLLGPAGVPVVVLLGVSSPWVVRLAGRVLRSGSKGDDVVGEMTTLQLCQVWVVTGDQLRTCTPDLRFRLASARQLCLDELERRDPDGVAAWLASANASAAGDPARFLIR